MTKLYQDELTLAREWLAECTWADAEPAEIMDPEYYSDDQIARAIERHFDGGIQSFVESCGVRS